MGKPLNQLSFSVPRDRRPKSRAERKVPVRKENGLKCEVCYKPLMGKQTKFCRRACANKYWEVLRLQGKAAPGFTDPDPVIQAFLTDFRELLMKHHEAVELLGARRKYG